MGAQFVCLKDLWSFASTLGWNSKRGLILLKAFKGFREHLPNSALEEIHGGQNISWGTQDNSRPFSISCLGNITEASLALLSEALTLNFGFRAWNATEKFEKCKCCVLLPFIVQHDSGLLLKFLILYLILRKLSWHVKLCALSNHL